MLSGLANKLVDWCRRRNYRLLRILFLFAVLFALGAGGRMAVCKLVVRKVSLIELVGIGDLRGARFVAKWDPSQINQIDSFDEIIKSRMMSGRDSVKFGSLDIAPLHLACMRGNVEMTTMLLDMGADPNIGFGGESTSWRPLHFAAERGRESLIEPLLRYGALLDVTEDTNGETALHTASKNGHVEFVRKLLLLGSSSINMGSNIGTPIHLAAGPFWSSVPRPPTWRNDRAQIIKYLLEAGADPNSQDAYGWSPLHMAAMDGYLEGVELLFRAGGDVNHTDDREGKTPLNYAREGKHSEVIQFLEGLETPPSDQNVPQPTIDSPPPINP